MTAAAPGSESEASPTRTPGRCLQPLQQERQGRRGSSAGSQNASDRCVEPRSAFVKGCLPHRPVTSDQCTPSRPEGGRSRAHEQEVASSCTRSSLLAQPCGYGALAQLGERRLCKPEVTGSIPVRSIDSTSWLRAPSGGPWLLTFVLDLRQ